ncbi:MAG: hypothetical protein ACYS9X_00660 [Planctomycetota bacterium]
MPIILFMYLFLGASVTLMGPRSLVENTSDLLLSIGMHVAGIAFAVFASLMARKLPARTFLGLSAVMWPVAAVVCYVVGLVGCLFV